MATVLILETTPSTRTNAFLVKFSADVTFAE